MANNEVLRIDVDKILQSKMGDKAKRVPRFLVSWLKRRLHQDEVNAFLEKEGDIQGVPWVEDVVEYLGMKLVIEGEENLPAVDDPKR